MSSHWENSNEQKRSCPRGTYFLVEKNQEVCIPLHYNCYAEKQNRIRKYSIKSWSDSNAPVKEADIDGLYEMTYEQKLK